MKTFTKTIRNRDGLNLWSESFGDPGSEPVLLVMGAMNQGVFWYDSFCELLCGRDYRVIRYDHRDTGKSSTVDFSRHPYDLDDLTRDAVAVLDGLGHRSAHIVGLSMGGYIGQLMALDYPERVRSLTMISSSTDLSPLASTASSAFQMPNPQDWMMSFMRRMTPFGFGMLSSPEALLSPLLEGWRMALGPRAPFDETFWGRLVLAATMRPVNPLAALNHPLAVSASKPTADRIGGIDKPTLVIHGRLDPCVPLSHGESLAAGIGGAKLHILDNMGHIFPPEWSLHLVDAIAAHLGSAQQLASAFSAANI